MPLGYWEAKDADDDLDAEVSKKFKRGYGPAINMRASCMSATSG